LVKHKDNFTQNNGQKQHRNYVIIVLAKQCKQVTKCKLYTGLHTTRRMCCHVL